MPHQQVPTTSTYRILGPPQELDRTVAVPAYPRASRSHQRRRKRNKKQKKGSKNRPRTNSSSSGEDRRKGLPMPHVIPTLEETDDAPQVLLWHSNRSSVRRSSGSSGGEDNNNKEEERNTTSSSDIFRYQTVRRQGPDMELVQHVQQEENHDPLDLLAPRGPQWFQWEYWRERLFERRCCLPERTTSLKRREPLIDYRPSYLGRDHISAIYTASPWGGPVRQQQQHYYVMPQWPPPQISPLTDAGMTFAAFSPIHEHLMKPSAVHYSTPNNRSFPQAAGAAMAPQETAGLPEDFLAAPIDVHQKPSHSNNKSKAGKCKKHHRKSSSLLGTHYEVPPTNLNPMMDPMQETKAPLDPVMDAQSVSSLDSNWKTPVQQQVKVVIPPDTNTTEASNNSAMSNRLKGIRRSLSRSSSPRPGSNLKPPVPPPRRQSSSGSKHKVQITNSTVASTALPPLPSPPSHTNGIPIPTGVRERSFSEASANTNGSRHRRGGTVCEFSFESLSMNPTNSTTNGPSKPPRSSIRSSSLPLEVQIQVHVPSEEPIRMVDSKDSWGVTPAKSYFVEDEEGETPEGYISPLEEEQFTLLVAGSPGGDDRTNTTTSPREVTSTASEAYAGDIDSPQTTTSTSNPQDSLCGDDSRGDEENNPHVINFEQTSPFAKLKDPPSIPPGESWMWSWVNKKDNSNGPKTPVVPLTGRANAVTPTQSPSSAGSSSSSSGEKETPKPRREYLPKDPTIEQSWRSQHATTALQGIAVSGWMAFGLGDDILKMLLQDGTNLERSDIAYVVLPNGSEQLWVSKLDGSFDSIDLSGCRVEVHEISREHGRAIYLKRKALGETLCTLLPVCLPEEYNGDEAAFGDGSLCFPKGDYLPDDQQYTTMHIMFALDALLKSKENFAI